MKKQRFVLDTSAFTGGNRTKKQTEKHILDLIKLISKAKKANVTCYIPPSVWIELEGMLKSKKIPKKEIDKLDAWLVQKSPSRMELLVPAEFIYEYVREVRERINKGLREAEKAVLAVCKGQDREDALVIKDLRNRYRTKMRQGLLDSIEDLDVLMLAKELKAGIVAVDEGIECWSDTWGIRFIHGDSFPKLLKEYIKGGK